MEHITSKIWTNECAVLYADNTSHVVIFIDAAATRVLYFLKPLQYNVMFYTPQFFSTAEMDCLYVHVC